MNPRKHLLFLILSTLNLLSHPSTAFPRNITFQFPPLPLQNITLLGDSYHHNQTLTLTLDSNSPSSSSGTIIYNTPVRFSDTRTNSTTSFSTTFSFSIINPNPLSLSGTGGGLSFFISPENHTLGSPGGYLGLVNSSQLTQNKFIAIEFDTRLDPHFNDPNQNHIGLDIDSLNSIATADCISAGIDLRTGVSFTSWIDYFHDKRNLQVFLTRSGSGSGLKPENPLLNVNIDLSVYFQELMYLGFSGSTEGNKETHSVHNWSFKSFGIKRFNPRMDNPHNVSTDTVTVPIRLPDGSRVRYYNNRRKMIGLGLEVSGSVFIFAGVLVFGYVSVKKWREIKTEMRIKVQVMRKPREFSYKELKTATNNFHSSRIIGHGSFGTVYKAFMLSSGTTAAVKRSLRSREAKTEFFAELSAIAGLRHKNLVQLLGWCVKRGELLLVYELMPYGSIESVLYQDPDHWGFLKWDNRYNIAVGLASVLAYLHQECDKLVIHRDIKSSNVMLDANLNARLGDFGLARLIDHDKSPVSTLTAGTAGYLAPEYLHCGKANDKTDVYSYGVVVLEVCCGRRPIEMGVPNKMNLVDWVWDLHTNGEVLGAIDKRLNGEFDEEEGKRLLMVGLSCVNPRSEMRPSMRRVLQVLNREVGEIEVPSVKPKVSFSTSMPLSVDDLVRCEEHGEHDEDNGSDCGFQIRIDRFQD